MSARSALILAPEPESAMARAHRLIEQSSVEAPRRRTYHLIEQSSIEPEFETTLYRTPLYLFDEPALQESGYQRSSFRLLGERQGGEGLIKSGIRGTAGLASGAVKGTAGLAARGVAGAGRMLGRGIGNVAGGLAGGIANVGRGMFGAKKGQGTVAHGAGQWMRKNKGATAAAAAGAALGGLPGAVVGGLAAKGVGAAYQGYKDWKARGASEKVKKDKAAAGKDYKEPEAEPTTLGGKLQKWHAGRKEAAAEKAAATAAAAPAKRRALRSLQGPDKGRAARDAAIASTASAQDQGLRDWEAQQASERSAGDQFGAPSQSMGTIAQGAEKRAGVTPGSSGMARAAQAMKAAASKASREAVGRARHRTAAGEARVPPEHFNPADTAAIRREQAKRKARGPVDAPPSSEDEREAADAKLAGAGQERRAAELAKTREAQASKDQAAASVKAKAQRKVAQAPGDVAAGEAEIEQGREAAQERQSQSLERLGVQIPGRGDPSKPAQKVVDPSGQAFAGRPNKLAKPGEGPPKPAPKKLIIPGQETGPAKKLILPPSVKRGDPLAKPPAPAPAPAEIAGAPPSPAGGPPTSEDPPAGGGGGGGGKGDSKTKDPEIIRVEPAGSQLNDGEAIKRTNTPTGGGQKKQYVKLKDSVDYLDLFRNSRFRLTRPKLLGV